ncbi:TPA: anaerobic ribonucleoside-triphosphate reductase activating protein [Vibrio parahaemolyticus]
MNYSALRKEDYANGDGRRVSLFVSGCEHACEGCFNQKAMSFTAGHPFTMGTMSEIVEALHDADGFSLLGGEPMHPRHQDVITFILRFIKTHLGKNVWVWTGYTHEQLLEMEHPALKYVDVLIDGKYEKSQRTVKPWRGSDNQRLLHLIDCKVIKEC